jgi:hypothetical protein
MKFAMNVLAFAIVFLLYVGVNAAFNPPMSVPRLKTFRKSLRHTMCSSHTSMSNSGNKTKTDLEIDLYFRMEEWRSLTSTVIKKAAGEETFFEADE